MSRLIVAAGLTLPLLAACSETAPFGGAYADRDGLYVVEFKSDQGAPSGDKLSGQGFVLSPTEKGSVAYVADRQSVTLKTAGGDQTLSRQADGSLQGPGGLILRRGRLYDCTDVNGAIGSLQLTAFGRAFIHDPDAKPDRILEFLGSYDQVGKTVTIHNEDFGPLSYEIHGDKLISVVPAGATPGTSHIDCVMRAD